MMAGLVAWLFVTQVVAEVIPVTTQKLSELFFFPVRDAPATAVSLNDTRVSSEIHGILKQLDVRVGESVKQGDVVALVECEEYEIAVTQAAAAYKAGNAKYKFEKSQLTKANKLAKTKSISSEEVDRRNSNAVSSLAETERLRAALKAARRSVGKCAIKAPFDAVVIERIASLGDYLVPGTAVVRLLDRQEIEISAKVQEQDLDSLKEAKEMAFIGRNRSYPVRLRTILPLMETRIRSYEVRLLFSGDERPSPGSTGRLQWTIPEAHVPAELLVRRGDDLGIFLEQGGVARFVKLRHAHEGQPAAVEPVVRGNVIVDGRFRVREGDEVRVIEQ